jgi:hypothetical protein
MIIFYNHTHIYLYNRIKFNKTLQLEERIINRIYSKVEYEDDSCVRKSIIILTMNQIKNVI